MVGTTAVSVGTHVPLVTAQSSCEELEFLENEIESVRSEIAEHQTALEQLPDAIADRRRRILELHTSASPPRFSGAPTAQAREIGLAARESVVVLDVTGAHSQGTATAWFVTEQYLLMNAQNVDGDYEVLFGETVHGETFEAELIDRVENQQPDVALLRTDFDGTPLPVGHTDSLARDEPLVQVGHPGDFGFWVITLGGYVDHRSSNELSATIPGLQGNSGSPILDLNGDVIAMTFGGESTTGPTIEPTDDEVRVGLLSLDPFTTAVPIQTAIDRMEAWA